MKNGFKFLAVGLLAVVVGFVLYGLNHVAHAESYVVLDVQEPSVELITNRKDVVIKVNALNEEGALIIANEDLVGMDVADTSERIINLAIELGYIKVDALENDPNTVLVTTLHARSRVAVKLRAKIYKRLDTYFMNNGIWAIVLTNETLDNIDQEAEALGITPSKLRIIKSIQFVDPTFDTQVGAKMSVPGLLNLVKEKKPIRTVIEDLTNRKNEIEQLLPTLDAVHDANQIEMLTTELTTINTKLTEINQIKTKVQADKQQLRERMKTRIEEWRQNHPNRRDRWQHFKNNLTPQQKQALLNRLYQRYNR